MKILRALPGAVLALVALPPCVSAQSVTPISVPPVAPAAVADHSAVATPPPPAEGFARVPANTVVNFDIAEALSSKTSQIDAMFPIVVSSDVVIDGKTVIAAGTIGQGQVVHAAKARALGKAGELIVAARYLSCGDVHVPLKNFRFGQTGHDRSDLAMAAGIAVPLAGLFVTGGESTILSGTHAYARTASVMNIAAAPISACAPPARSPAATPAAGAAGAATPVSAAQTQKH